MSENKQKIKKILEEIKNSEINLSDVVEEFNNERIINKSKKYLDHHFKEGMRNLDDIQDSEIKEILFGISNYLINRSN